MRSLPAMFSASPLVKANIVPLFWQTVFFFFAEVGAQVIVSRYRDACGISVTQAFALVDAAVLFISLSVVWRTYRPFLGLVRAFAGEGAALKALWEVIKLLCWQSVAVAVVALPAIAANDPFTITVSPAVSLPGIVYYLLFVIVLALLGMMLTSVGILASVAAGAAVAGGAVAVLVYALIGAAKTVAAARFAMFAPKAPFVRVFGLLDALNTPDVLDRLTTLRTGVDIDVSPGFALLIEAVTITFVCLGVAFAAAYVAIRLAQSRASARRSVTHVRAGGRAPYLWVLACIALNFTAALYVVLESDRPKMLLYRFPASYPANVLAILLIGQIAMASIAVATAPRHSDAALGGNAFKRRLALAAEMNGTAILAMVPFVILAQAVKLTSASAYPVVLVPAVAAAVILGAVAVLVSSLGDGAVRALTLAIVLFIVTALVFFSGAPFYSVYSGPAASAAGADLTAGPWQASYPSLPLQIDQVVQLAQAGGGRALAGFGAFALVILFAASFFMLRWARDNFAEAPREPG